MHCLHKILVYIPHTVGDDKKIDRNKQINYIRDYAEAKTEQFADVVFDYRSESCSAGAYDDKYPVNVLFAVDDIDRFVGELEEVVEHQKISLSFWLSTIKKNIGTDLTEIVNHLLINEPDYLSNTGYQLFCVAKLLYGEYIFESGFYNTEYYTSRIYTRDIEQIKESPKDWVLVMLDYHF